MVTKQLSIATFMMTSMKAVRGEPLNGHYGLPTDELLSLAEKLLEVPVELVRSARP